MSSSAEAGSPEVVVQVGAEGVCVTLEGRVDEQGNWWFRVDLDASTFAALLPDEVKGAVLQQRGEWVPDFDRGLQQLDRESWARLSPIRVHPESAERVLDAVRARLGGRKKKGDDELQYKYEQWRRVCTLRTRGGSPLRRR